MSAAEDRAKRLREAARDAEDNGDRAEADRLWGQASAELVTAAEEQR